MKNKRSIHDLNLSSPEMVELASRYSNQQQPSPPYGMDGMQGSFQPYGNDLASGVGTRKMNLQVCCAFADATILVVSPFSYGTAVVWACESRC
mmetsp:Transcript_1585/g.5694  ORF Transcript_1585/g.5694 Transcript_1585/m.5694 type:complete len:93 (-) Transcript_1585:1825-2103(-)